MLGRDEYNNEIPELSLEMESNFPAASIRPYTQSFQQLPSDVVMELNEPQASNDEVEPSDDADWNNLNNYKAIEAGLNNPPAIRHRYDRGDELNHYGHLQFANTGVGGNAAVLPSAVKTTDLDAMLKIAAAIGLGIAGVCFVACVVARPWVNRWNKWSPTMHGNSGAKTVVAQDAPRDYVAIDMRR